MRGDDAKLTDDQLRHVQQGFETQMGNRVYEAGLLFESLEGRGLVAGNGHHLAQEVAAFAVKLLKSRWVKRPS